MPIRLENLTVAYRRHPVVHHVSGSFVPGELTAIVGPNGAGKSSLLKSLVGLLPASDGRIDLAGLRPRDIGYLPQQSSLDRSFPLTVGDVVTLGHWHSSGWFRGVSREARLAAERKLDVVGLAGFAPRNVDELSMGQFQRVLFARLLVQDARVILLDEPFTSLDAKTTDDLLAVVQNWRREQRTVIAVLHDMEQVRRHFPQTLLMARECIGWGDTAAVLTPANLLRANGMTPTWTGHAPICDIDGPDAVATVSSPIAGRP
ncbi:ABC transporter ATP-binding protein [Pigmentiphaga aceris]|uniref:ABC transporter ATP-binding protein n=1 Tax=Pigmentiphaga aceris TaxID=1940612 RepID=A0A5C0AZW7_9BURK|nr:ABC transporter ATP-binding protein [Pigmentiphaga aceris]QEI06983.1 ABC transporter ATP-binding protein [Pigmentiphaga aceris]